MTQTEMTQAPAQGKTPLADGAAVLAEAGMSVSGLGLHSLRAGCDALAAVVQARAVRWHLTPEGADLADGLSAAGLCVAQADLPAVPADAFPVPRQLPQRGGMPTDRCDLVIRLDAAGGDALVWLELQEVPQGWGAQARLDAIVPLARLLRLQICALHRPAAVLAEPMLALLERIREVDDTAAPHLLMGLLHFLAGRMPAPVEVTALRIAGLCDMPATRIARPDISLNADGWRLLAQAGLGQVGLEQAGLGQGAAADPACHAAADSMEAAADVPAQPSVALHPFARLHLLKREFDVAQDEAAGLLWFRPHNPGAEWAVLQRGTADGWTAIATEVLEKTIDILRAFAEMHLIRRRDMSTDEVAEIYDLHGQIWWLRESEAGLEARLDQGPWVLHAVPDTLTGKARAVEVLMRLAPDLAVAFHAQAHDWAARMAHSVQVKPVMGLAAG